MKDTTAAVAPQLTPEHQSAPSYPGRGWYWSSPPLLPAPLSSGSQAPPLLALPSTPGPQEWWADTSPAFTKLHMSRGVREWTCTCANVHVGWGAQNTVCVLSVMRNMKRGAKGGRALKSTVIRWSSGARPLQANKPPAHPDCTLQIKTVRLRNRVICPIIQKWVESGKVNLHLSHWTHSPTTVPWAWEHWQGTGGST